MTQLSPLTAKSVALRLTDRVSLPILESPVKLARLNPEAIPILLNQTTDEQDLGNLFMRIFYLMNALRMKEFALEMQAKALSYRRIYRLEGPAQPKMRLLALLGPGDWEENAPLEFLVENSAIRLDLLYILADGLLPEHIPDHDVVIVALGESSQNNLILNLMGQMLAHWPRPVINHPSRVLGCARDKACDVLQGIEGLCVPKTFRVGRDDMRQLTYPLIIRPMDKHGGQGLKKIDDADQLAQYLAQQPELFFYLAEYIDYQSADGLFRKYRIALLDGKPYISHLAISNDWIVHYASAGMQLSEEKRAEEAHVMQHFDSEFVSRHQLVLDEICNRFQLEYLILDCAELSDGRLLYFEADNGGWVHAVDPIENFSYKKPVMQKLFDAFFKMLESRLTSES